MTKKLIVALAVLGVAAYILVAPIYGTVSYGDSSKEAVPGSSAYVYLWTGARRETHHFLLFGRTRTQVTAVTRVVVRDEGDRLGEIQITEASVRIDGQAFPLPALVSRTLELDRSVANMHAGVGGTALVRFELPRSPKEHLELRLTGTAKSTDGTVQAFDIAVEARIITKKFVLPFAQLILERLSSV